MIIEVLAAILSIIANLLEIFVLIIINNNPTQSQQLNSVRSTIFGTPLYFCSEMIQFHCTILTNDSSNLLHVSLYFSLAASNLLLSHPFTKSFLFVFFFS